MHYAYMTAESDAMAARLREARAKAYDNPTAAAGALGVPAPTYLGHENGSRGFRTSAERYADFFRVNLEWLLTGRGLMKKTPSDSDGLKSVAEPLTLIGGDASAPDIDVRAMPRNLPILGSGVAGDDGLFDLNGITIDYVRRPARLVGIKDAYALYLNGSCMSPWRENGQKVYVHPHLIPDIGDYVVVQLKQEHEGGPFQAYIKRLVRRSASEVRLLQYNPKDEKTIATKRIHVIHKILDWDELLGI